MVNAVHEIRFCRVDESSLLQDFINQHWKKNHVLSVNKSLLDWQHFDKKNNRYNYVVAYNKKACCFDAILGFIPTAHYDPALFDEKDIWLAIWKVADNQESTGGLGIALLHYLKERLAPNSIISVGINKPVSRLYKQMGYDVGILNHYYLCDPNCFDYKIIKFKEGSNFISFSQKRGSRGLKFFWTPVFSGMTLTARFFKLFIRKKKDSYIKKITLTEIDDNFFFYYPKKSKAYFINRYASHPSYEYRFYGICSDETLKAVFVARIISVNGAHCVRIIDICGDLKNIKNTKKSFIALLRVLNAEYIDIVSYGLSADVLSNLGFSPVDDDVLVPHYFEPFEQRSVNIMFAYQSAKTPFCIFKGDSDQDRPNKV